jgi:hypothetical protein
MDAEQSNSWQCITVALEQWPRAVAKAALTGAWVGLKAASTRLPLLHADGRLAATLLSGRFV